jgi:hypothetical protein
MGELTHAYNSTYKILKRRDHLGGLFRHGMIILNSVLKK